MVRLELKDCMQQLSELENESVDLLITDPPYGMEFQSFRRKKVYDKIENDDNLDWLPEWLAEIKRVLKQDAHAYIFCSHHNLWRFLSLVDDYLPYKNLLIWQKNNHGSGDLLGDYAPQYEMIIYCSNGKKKLNGKRVSNVLEFDKTDNALHPTQKPVDLLRFLITKSTKEGDTVLDCFSGSGSTAVACIIENRKFIGAEIKPDYHSIAQRRIKEESSKISLFPNAAIAAREAEQKKIF